MEVYKIYFDSVRIKLILKIILVLTLSIVIVGCGNLILQPRANTFKMDSITEFTSSAYISIINSQADSVNRSLYEDNDVIQGNLKSWTDTAVEITKRELAARGAILLDNEQRKLQLSIISIEGIPHFSTLHFIIKLEVETGSGYKSTYIGDNQSPATGNRAADGAVMRSVAAMFRDPEIIKYITSSKVLKKYEKSKDEISPYETLEKLKILFDKGILTIDEYTDKKNEILKNIK